MLLFFNHFDWNSCSVHEHDDSHFYNRGQIGSFSNDDGNGNVNVVVKYELALL